jgi:DNA-directed RNA polymerase specialized sigma24 family protein
VIRTAARRLFFGKPKADHGRAEIMADLCLGGEFCGLFDAEQYASVRSRLIKYFRWNRAADAENLADEVICRVLRRIAGGAGIHTELGKYCLGVAANVLRETWKWPKQEELEPDQACLRPLQPHSLNPVEESIYLKECLGALPVADRELLADYHLEDRAALAGRLGTTANGLRLRIFRISRKLADFAGQARDGD